MKLILSTVAAAFFALAAVPPASATTVGLSGTITVEGAAWFETDSAGSVGQLMKWEEIRVMDAQGAFGNHLSNGGSTFGAPWNFGAPGVPVDPASPSSLLANFLTVGGITFHLTSWQIDQSANATGDAFTLTGSGYVTGSDFAATYGTWMFSILDSAPGGAASFTFAADAPIGVPETGSTIALLGFSLAGLAFLLRKRRAAELKRLAARL